MNFSKLPEIGKTYTYVDDGKLHRNRLYNTTISDIIKFKEIDDETLLLWKDEVESCYWLYATETDVFIKATLALSDTIENIVFVRKKDGGFFSLGFWGGCLDVDGSMLKKLEEYENSEY